MHVDDVTDRGDVVCVTARTGTARSACRECGTMPARGHSRYVRRLHDLPVAVRPMVIALKVRRNQIPQAEIEPN
ncbi:transposase family protein [Actinomadura sp. 6N118]|uniref:transposase family protein n=1 Tax=Actinomadura sp. 6N118 TaxID=3375151 RepID=UPI003793FC8E